jgi:hypothetical protein
MSPYASPVARGLADLRAAAIGGHTGVWLEAAVVTIATVAAFLLGYFHAAAQPVDGSWAQIHMTAAVNFACTGHFGPLRLAPDATAADAAALEQVMAFLRVHRPDLSCDLLPQHLVSTSFRDGFDTGNAELPVYLMLLFGVLWRWFGLNWHLTAYVIGATVAASFLCIYVCARPFMPVLVAAAVALLFLMSPLFIANVASPRDALKFPFAVTIAALLVTAAAVPRAGAPPRMLHPALRLMLLAAFIGTVLGIGFGFRSDILIFLVPAVLVVCAVSDTGRVGWRASLGARAAALAVLLLYFAIAGSLPLYNDYVAHPSFAHIGFHQVAAGLLGSGNGPLFQSHALDAGVYMFRSSVSPDVAIALRIMEYASRKFGEDVAFVPGAGAYWTYSRSFFMDLVRLIPADLLSGAIGNFFNYMTLPNRQGSLLSFIANLSATFIFLSLITARFGTRAAVATVIVMATVLAVTSLRFELRHMFYAYVFIVLAWGATVAVLLRVAFLPRDAEREFAKPAIMTGTQAAGSVALLVVAVCVVVLGALWAARVYQVSVLHRLIADWSNQPRVAAQYRISRLDADRALVQVLSPMALTRGGERAPDAAVTGKVEMGVVAIAFDGARCTGHQVTATAVSDAVHSNPDADPARIQEIFGMRETFSVPLTRPETYVAYLPAFFILLGDASNSIAVKYSGVELDRESVPCVTGVSTITAFKKSDVLFDFFVPADPSAVTRNDLFQRVRVPGTKFFL